MLSSLLVAGFGGQGVMVIGKLIGECAFMKGLNVTFLPSYGPEQRGGTANCTVMISDRAIGSVVSEELDVLCAMNQPSLEKFISHVKTGGIVMINSSNVKRESIERNDVKIIEVAADQVAYELGSTKVANVVMLAVYAAASKVMPIDEVENLVMQKLSRKPQFLEMNRQAFRKGVEIANAQMGGN